MVSFSGFEPLESHARAFEIDLSPQCLKCIKFLRNLVACLRWASNSCKFRSCVLENATQFANLPMKQVVKPASRKLIAIFPFRGKESGKTACMFFWSGIRRGR